jgi:hypothetical protein
MIVTLSVFGESDDFLSKQESLNRLKQLYELKQTYDNLKIQSELNEWAKYGQALSANLEWGKKGQAMSVINEWLKEGERLLHSETITNRNLQTEKFEKNVNFLANREGSVYYRIDVGGINRWSPIGLLRIRFDAAIENDDYETAGQILDTIIRMSKHTVVNRDIAAE